jgi:hypothetical protein
MILRFIILLCLFGPILPAQKFYPDDPLVKEPTPRKVKDPRLRKLSDYYDLFENIFDTPGEKQPKGAPPIPARNTNTLGDPMDGGWYTKRHFWQRMSSDDLRRGPIGTNPPQPPITIIRAKTEGITPGFTVLDSRKQRYFLKFDPASNPELATSADVIGARIFHALGYHVPDNYIAEFSEDQVSIGPDVTVKDAKGRPYKMSRKDLADVLLKTKKTPRNTYRVVASQALEGKDIGPFRWFGVRADDPNDYIPHEHRRELRAASVFCAWLNHEDSRAINTLDTFVTKGDSAFIRHHLIDFGATLGSASDKVTSARSGAYFFDWTESAKAFFSLGLYVPWYAKSKFPSYPAVGKFDYEAFDPVKWVPEYPNPSFLNALPDDQFWAAKQVKNFTDEELRAIVREGRISDPAAEEFLVKALAVRRDKIWNAYRFRVLPVDRFEIREGRLVFEDLSTEAGPFTVRWASFDNMSGQSSPISGAEGPALPRSPSTYLLAEIQGKLGPSKKVLVYIREERQIVGVERTW